MPYYCDNCECAIGRDEEASLIVSKILCLDCAHCVSDSSPPPPPWYEKAMLGHGYEEIGTGGGCTGWEKEFTHRNPAIPPDTILITHDNQGHELAPLIVTHDVFCYAGVSE